MRIDQFLQTLAAKDGIGNEAMIIKSILKKWGHKSRIYAEHYTSEIKKHFNSVSKHKRSDIIIYHHSIGCDVANYIKDVDGKKIMIYHNITPERYLVNNAEVARQAKIGREQLKELKECFDLSLADSEYNRQELEDLGYKNTKVLPLLINYNIYSIKPSDSIIKKFGKDNFKNIIFVGKIAPHKNQSEIIKAFYCYKNFLNPKSRLFLVGSTHAFYNYSLTLRDLIKKLGLENDVFLTDSVKQTDLNAYYEVADLFVSMSEHEGFCIPLIESMYFNIPIIAYRKSAVPWTLGSSAILFDTKNYLEIAELIDHVLGSSSLVDIIIEKQQKRLRDFKQNRIETKFREFLRLVE